MDCHSHSAADCRRSSADEAVSAVQNVAAAPFFLFFMATEKENNQGLEGQDTGKEEEEEEKNSPCIPPSV